MWIKFDVNKGYFGIFNDWAQRFDAWNIKTLINRFLFIFFYLAKCNVAEQIRFVIVLKWVYRSNGIFNSTFNG